jgi:hypothetical protein
VRLSIQNFRRCRDVQIEGSRPVQLLLGENQQGKSSILGAVTVALTGTQPAWLTRRGESIYDLRREGAKTAEMDLMFVYGQQVPCGIGVHRVLSAKAQALQVEVAYEDGPMAVVGTTTQQQDDLCSRFGLTLKQLSCLLDAGQFLALDAKEQTAFLAGVSGAELDWPTLSSKILWEQSDAGECFEAGFSTKQALSGVDLLDAALKWSTEERKVAKRLRDEKKTLLEVAQREAAAKPDGDEPEDLEARVTDLDKRHEAAIRRGGEIAQADQRLTAARESVADADVGQRKLAETANPSVALAEAQAALKPLDDALTLAGERERRAVDAYGPAEAKARGLREAQSAADALLAKGECPTCRRPFDAECSATLSIPEDKLEDSENNLGSAACEREAAHSAVLAAANAARPARERVEELERAVSDYQRTASNISSVLDSARKQLEVADASRAGLTDPEDAAVIAAEIATLEGWADWKNGQANVRGLTAELASQEATVETWEWLVAKFGSGPGSYRAELLEGKLGALEAAVNEALRPLLDEEIAFPSGDAGLSVIGRGHKYPATREFLSGSEMLRLQIALQYGLCKALGFPLLLVDCEAALDARTTAGILGFCKSVAANWPEVTMLVAMAPTRTDWREQFNPALFEGWADVWAIVDGTAERMTAGEDSGTDSAAPLPQDAAGDSNVDANCDPEAA